MSLIWVFWGYLLLQMKTRSAIVTCDFFLARQCSRLNSQTGPGVPQNDGPGVLHNVSIVSVIIVAFRSWCLYQMWNITKQKTKAINLRFSYQGGASYISNWGGGWNFLTTEWFKHSFLVICRGPPSIFDPWATQSKKLWIGKKCLLKRIQRFLFSTLFFKLLCFAPFLLYDLLHVAHHFIQ